MMTAFRKNSGFSLIELAMILMIVGLVGSTLLEIHRNYTRGKIKNDNVVHTTAVKAALQGFVTNYNRLPCPADPTLRPGDAMAGIENCAAAGNIVVPGQRSTSSSSSIIPGNWTGYNPADGTALNIFAVKDPVVIGSVPYVTLGVTVRQSLDGWGNKMTYAVSQYLTTAPIQKDNGVIDIMKLDRSLLFPFAESLVPVKKDVSPCPAGTDPTCDVLPAPGTFLLRGTFMYVLLSHGRDGKGAYTHYGQQPIPCGTTTGRDNENCNGDFRFVDASVETNIYNPVHTNPPLVGPEPDLYFDDSFAVYQLENSNDKWSYESTTRIYNKSLLNVGIGTPAPGAQLDVNGVILSDAQLANFFCSQPWDDPLNGPGIDKPAYCFPARLIDGPDGSYAGSDRALGCPGQFLKGIASAAADCETGGDLRAISPVVTCTGGQYMIGLDATGGVLCATPP